MDTKQIIVIGAGIGGLTAGLALQRRGFKVKIYERAPEIREIGAGIVLSANARRALRDLGIDDALEAASSCAPIMHTCNYSTGVVTVEVDNARIAAQYGLATLQVHRADLHALVKDAVLANDPEALYPDHEFIRLEQDSASVSVYFSNGSSDCAGAVIGADGNASAVRSFLFPGEPTIFNGQVAFRALVPNVLVPKRVKELQYAMHRSPKRYLLFYALRGGRLMNLIGCGQSSVWEEEGWSIPATNEEFAKAYSDFTPVVQELISCVPADALFKWGLRDREPLHTWTCGRVTMLGDAAHPMMPFLGQGACMAIEDGLLIGRAFAAAKTVEESFRRYELARKSRANTVQLWTRAAGQALQDPNKPWRSAIDLGILDYDPTTAPV